jgi:enterochelin esterase family protein
MNRLSGVQFTGSAFALVAFACAGGAACGGISGPGGGNATSGNSTGTMAGSGQGSGQGASGSTSGSVLGMSGSGTAPSGALDAAASGAGGSDASAAVDSPIEGGTPAFGDSGVTDPGSAGDGDRTIGPNYTPDPMVAPQAGAQKGQTISFQMLGSQSKIYPGINGSYTRGVSVYIPKQYVPGTPAPLIVTQDAMGQGQLPTVLDNLISTNKLPKIVVLFVGNGGGDAVGSERGLEYDTVSGLFAEFIQTEVVPRAITEVKTRLNIDLKITDDPEARMTLGGSSGGAASFSMAWWHPDLFHKVLTYSGTYVTQVPANSPFPHGCWIYHDVDPYNMAMPNGLIVQHCESAAGFTGNSAPTPCDTPLSQMACEAVTGCAWNTKVNRPLRIWHESGTNDLGAGGAPGGYRNFDLANQRMAAAFKLRGYHYHYDHALGAGHVDGRAVAQTLPEALLWVWRGYPVN